MEKNFENIEKSNCHIHLTGALHPAELRRIASVSEVELGFVEPLELHLAFDDPTIWAVAKEVTSTEVGLSMAINEVVHAEKRAGVSYIELTLNPSGMLRRGLETDQLINCLEASAVKASGEGVRLLYKFGINRKDGPQSVSEVAEVFMACPAHLRHSIDLNGDERAFPTVDYVDALSKLSKKGVSITVHAGEFLDSADSLRDAIRIEPFRIAHATAVIQEEDLLTLIKKQDIEIEIAPTSNYRRGAILNKARHHIRRLVNEHVRVVLGNDDPGFFGSTMTDELSSLEQMGMTEDEILALNNDINERVNSGQKRLLFKN